jgi:hypothetical protein
MSNVIEGCFGPTKKRRMNAVNYARDVEKTKNLPYERKFATLLSLCKDAASGKFDAVIVAYPEALGDSYEELKINLSLLANAGLLVALAGPSPGGSGHA